MKTDKAKTPIVDSTVYSRLDASDVVHVAGGIWAVLDKAERFFVNIATNVCSCNNSICKHHAHATNERNRLAAIGFVKDIPDSDRLVLLAIRRGFREARKAKTNG